MKAAFLNDLASIMNKHDVIMEMDDDEKAFVFIFDNDIRSQVTIHEYAIDADDVHKIAERVRNEKQGLDNEN